MGFDITFHTITRAELHRFILDPIASPDLGFARLKELTQRPDHLQLLRSVYQDFIEWRLAADEPCEVASTFAFSTALIAGFLHPYWYARNQALSLLPVDIAKVFTPLRAMADDRFSRLLELQAGPFVGSFSASGLIAPDRFDEIQEIICSFAPKVSEGDQSARAHIFDDDGRQAITTALAYARERNAFLLEASDLVVPLQNRALTNFDNMRASFLGRTEP